jgi:hypothetical protein
MRKSGYKSNHIAAVFPRADSESSSGKSAAPHCAGFPSLGIFVKQLEQFSERHSWTF